ncbi:hypothetical protein H6G33_09770 [Calothrix sp. FACHB-1219]|uniref:hypothetical protein n=1 Tax=unclassified Calothrix TaxID=2619626 RepID=UPI001682E567|nr:MULTISPECIES: hypothetical protein [unclassified Calothrix]MBD2201633.1 hypothetical protein [Calothrix sp. FACHB-168]MBD2217319.1 hypothetical protein [Calothrix sp. FACHB-1219]
MLYGLEAKDKYALVIITEEGHTVVDHVANNIDDSVYVEDWEVYGLPQSEWRKAHHLTKWVVENRPNWKYYSAMFSIGEVMKGLIPG